MLNKHTKNFKSNFQKKKKAYTTFSRQKKYLNGVNVDFGWEPLGTNKESSALLVVRRIVL